MLISLTGAQSTGKSTLLELCCTHDYFSKYNCVKEVTRKVKRERGVVINEQGEDLTQLFILNEHLNNHTLVANTILDRCIVDGIVYTHYLHDMNQVSDWVYNYASSLFNMLEAKLDYIFYTDPADVPLVDDGERSVDVSFRERIIELFEYYLPHCSSKVVVLSGNPNERLEKLLDTIS